MMIFWFWLCSRSQVLTLRGICDFGCVERVWMLELALCLGRSTFAKGLRDGNLLELFSDGVGFPYGC